MPVEVAARSLFRGIYQDKQGFKEERNKTKRRKKKKKQRAEHSGKQNVALRCVSWPPRSHNYNNNNNNYDEGHLLSLSLRWPPQIDWHWHWQPACLPTHSSFWKKMTGYDQHQHQHQLQDRRREREREEKRAHDPPQGKDGKEIYSGGGRGIYLPVEAVLNNIPTATRVPSFVYLHCPPPPSTDGRH